MRSLHQTILAAKEGDRSAFSLLVRRFKRMAVGYAYARLRDFQLAEDAAQEAMVEMFQTIARLKRAEAFTAMLRRILVKQCDRIARRRRKYQHYIQGAAEKKVECPLYCPRSTAPAPRPPTTPARWCKRMKGTRGKRRPLQAESHKSIKVRKLLLSMLSPTHQG